MKDTIQVELGNETKEITMSYGLLNECAKVIGDIDGVPDMALNPDVRDRLLIELLSPRDQRGQIKEEISVFSLELAPEQVLTLLDWVGVHVVDFFLNSMTQVKSLLTDREGEIKSLMSISDGGES